ncbi:MAG TPA: N-acetylmuramoyl-L-alanine amidase [Clostridia bacterium]|nr:N-acetylmuramoyl-L-alanine amidase [Clostridia bacterium]
MARSAPDRLVRKLMGILPAIAVILGAGMLASSLMSAGSTWPVSGEATPGDDPPHLVVVIDAGHGGIDGGAVGIETGAVEKQLNLRYAFALKAELEARGMTVVLTRADDDSLASGKKADMAKRREIMNGSDADIVVSIHMNKFRDRTASGPMAFYMKDSVEGKTLATFVIKAICTCLERNARLASASNFFIVRESKVPAVLVECGFLSNATEEKLLQTDEHMQKIVKGIADGIEDYFGIPRDGGPDGAPPGG